MKLSTLAVAVCVVLFIGIGGCKQNNQKAVAPAPTPALNPHGQAGDAPLPAAGGLSGKVAETMNSGGYTYVSLDQKGKKTWVAMPQTKVKVGQNVTCQPGMVMQNFTSKTLNRTFDSIVFSGGLM